MLVGAGYNAEVGYVRRTGYSSFAPQLGYTFYPKRVKFIIRHGPQLQLDQLHSDGYGLTDQEFTLRYTGALPESEFSLPECKQGLC